MSGRPRERKPIPLKITERKENEVDPHKRGEENGGILHPPLEESVGIRPPHREESEGTFRVHHHHHHHHRGGSQGSIRGRHHPLDEDIKRRVHLLEGEENQIIPRHPLPGKDADAQTLHHLAAGSDERKQLHQRAGATDQALRLLLLVE